jgi:hypothetical protein
VKPLIKIIVGVPVNNAKLLESVMVFFGPLELSSPDGDVTNEIANVLGAIPTSRLPGIAPVQVTFDEVVKTVVWAVSWLSDEVRTDIPTVVFGAGKDPRPGPFIVIERSVVLLIAQVLLVVGLWSSTMMTDETLSATPVATQWVDVGKSSEMSSWPPEENIGLSAVKMIVEPAPSAPLPPNRRPMCIDPGVSPAAEENPSLPRLRV